MNEMPVTAPLLYDLRCTLCNKMFNRANAVVLNPPSAYTPGTWLRCPHCEGMLHLKAQHDPLPGFEQTVPPPLRAYTQMLQVQLALGFLLSLPSLPALLIPLWPLAITTLPPALLLLCSSFALSRWLRIKYPDDIDRPRWDGCNHFAMLTASTLCGLGLVRGAITIFYGH